MLPSYNRDQIICIGKENHSKSGRQPQTQQFANESAALAFKRRQYPYSLCLDQSKISLCEQRMCWLDEGHIFLDRGIVGPDRACIPPPVAQRAPETPCRPRHRSRFVPRKLQGRLIDLMIRSFPFPKLSPRTTRVMKLISSSHRFLARASSSGHTEMPL